jgi:hypothetical protein
MATADLDVDENSPTSATMYLAASVYTHTHRITQRDSVAHGHRRLCTCFEEEEACVRVRCGRPTVLSGCRESSKSWWKSWALASWVSSVHDRFHSTAKVCTAQATNFKQESVYTYRLHVSRYICSLLCYDILVCTAAHFPPHLQQLGGYVVLQAAWPKQEKDW